MIDPVLPTYARAPIEVASGEGCWLIDAQGRRHLDFGAGIAVNAFGHAHPELVAALTEQAGKLWHGLQRLDWTGDPVFEMAEVRARTNGLELTLTGPAALGSGERPRAYAVTRYRYEPTEDYGGPKLDETELPVRSVTMSDDRRTIFLELGESAMLEDHVYHVRIVGPWRDADGRRPWATEAWYTMNRVPRDRRVTPDPVPVASRANELTEAERAAGFRLLFDGESTDGWMAYGGGPVGEGWRIEDGALVRAEAGAGDLVTEEVFGDFELRLEWSVAPGGNSGIFFHVADGYGAVWETGPEMQILDNERHADGQSPLTSAGSCYALLAPEYDATYPPGQWNEVRIVVDGAEGELWLNGELQCRFDRDSERWADLVAGSKFASMPDFGRLREGRIALQDHGDEVRFRSIRIRTW